MVDYNQSLSVPEAIGRVQLLEDEALVWVEEHDPCRRFRRSRPNCRRVPHSHSDRRKFVGTARAYKEPFGGRFRLRDAGCHEDWRDYGLAAGG